MEDSMKKKIVIFLCAVLIIIAIAGACICINKAKEAEIEKTKEEKKQVIAVATIIIEDESIIKDTSKNYTADNQMINTYQELINSAAIKNKIKEKYPKVGDIELKKIKDSDIVKVIFICEEYNEDECIEIENMFLKEFSKRISELYNVKIYIIDEPAITWRYI